MRGKNGKGLCEGAVHTLTPINTAAPGTIYSRPVGIRADVFGTLLALRALEKALLPFVATREDMDLLCEIGHRQALGRPLTVSEALLPGLGSPATVQRRLQRLRAEGVLEAVHTGEDRRLSYLRLTPTALRAYGDYAAALGTLLRQQAAWGARRTERRRATQRR